MHKLAITFNKVIPSNYNFEDMGEKVKTYREFVSKCNDANLDVKILSTKDYLGDGIFLVDGKKIKYDICFDRSGGTKFPYENDDLRVIDDRGFKLLAWDKWLAYEVLSEYMPQTFLVEDKSQLPNLIAKIQGDMIVIKPTNGLKGLGMYVGSKDGAMDFQIDSKRKYVLQEFIDTKSGIPGVMTGRHDLRVVITNGKIIWSHFRTPPKGELKSNVAGGGILTEIDLDKIPEEVVKISNKIAKIFYDKFDNPLFSADFGIDERGKSWVFEINDQIGFPKSDAKGKEKFILELVENLISKV